MSSLKSLLRIFLLVLALCLLAIGARFASDNAQMVALIWGPWTSPEAPLFVWLILIALGSVLLVWLAFSLTLVRQRNRIRRLEAKLRQPPTSAQTVSTLD